MDVRTGLSYGDVLLVPQGSSVDSRDDVDLSTALAPDLELDVPVLGAAMDTVTEADLATELSAAGGLGVVHRFATVDEQAAEIRAVTDAGERAAVAVGIDEAVRERAAAGIDAGAAAVVVDVAHGHLERALDATGRLADAFPDVPLVVGNVATPEAVRDLAVAGADCVKVGVGPGSHCTTRAVAGAGVPQLTAVDDCADAARPRGVATIADGGIRTSGDAVKALMSGADAVMLGGFFAGTDEAPGRMVRIDGERYKVSRGMASEAANDDRTDKDVPVDAGEGEEVLTPAVGPLRPHLDEFLAGIRSGLSYCGGLDLATARDNAEFVRVTASAREREGIHSVEAKLTAAVYGGEADDD
ncbi:guanosine monophosphate reductase [Haloarchaeobius sp. HRN-SO-5]|uniref:guanosine monophosphate reductase n=1 Tax=Haloarchaeobius sp. HRN-SO-5 TaxID=3446118 RepID=UPI003EC0A020